MIVKIKCEVCGDIWTISEQVISICKQVGCWAEFVFNGVLVHVGPKSDVTKVCYRALEAVQNNVKVIYCE